MQSIEVDNDVFAYLQKHAQPFVDTPNSTLRRLLSIDSTGFKIAITSATHEELSEHSDSQLSQKSAEFSDSRRISGVSKRRFEESSTESRQTRSRSKEQKANLSKLIQENFLRDRQKLYLVDYRGNRVEKFSAIVSGNGLIYNDKEYSMSNLAQKLLTEVGFQSFSIRGPAHWVTEEGKSIKDLWKQHLEGNLTKSQRTLP